jgi:hypothetical protein
MILREPAGTPPAGGEAVRSGMGIPNRDNKQRLANKKKDRA